MSHFDFTPLVAIFGTSVTILRKSAPTNVNGYLQPNVTSSTIKAALVPASIEQFNQLAEGFTMLGDAWLITKEGNIRVNDEVTDATSLRWKVLQVVEYPDQGNIYVFSLKRLT